MAALTTAAVIGSAVLGAAATAYSVNQQSKAAKEQERRLAEQERQAKIAAREQASLEKKDDTGAEIKLGRDAAQAVSSTSAGAGGGTSRAGSVKSRVGGVTPLTGTRASKRIGL